MTIKLTIKDEVNINISGLPLEARRRLVSKFSYTNPTAKYMPQYQLSGWDGKIQLFSIGGTGYLTQMEKIIDILDSMNLQIEEIEDLRKPIDLKFENVDENYWAEKNVVWPEGHPFANQPVILRDHQVMAVNNFLENPQSLQVISTSGGKTVISATLAHKCEKFGRTITIVPNKSLVEQTLADFQLCNLDVGVYYGNKKELDKTHTICTWQSLNVWDKKSKASSEDIFTLEDFLSNMVAVLIDECHQAKAQVLRNLATQKLSHCPIRWGFTGTIPKLEHEAESIYVSLGPVVGKVTAKELQDKGILSGCHVHILQLLETVYFKKYQDEYNFLVTNKPRLDFIAKTCIEIGASGNTLILVDRIESGKYLHSQIPNSEFVHGTIASSKRKEKYDDIAFGDGKILIASYGVAAVGINIVRLNNVILLEPGKSFVRVIQSIGRGLRKGFDKDFVNIWDISSTCKYSKMHSTARKKFYKESEYPFTIKKIDYQK